jgi:hypothetical protein
MLTNSLTHSLDTLYSRCHCLAAPYEIINVIQKLATHVCVFTGQRSMTHGDRRCRINAAEKGEGANRRGV